MPIIIKKGSDVEKSKKKRKSKLLRKSDSQDSMESEKDFSKIATDMTDVIDFKVYRVIKPNFYNDTTRVNLIGEQFYQEEDVKNTPTDPAATADSDRPNIIPESKSAIPKHDSHINDLETLKEKLKQLDFVDILTKVKQQKKQVDAIKTGKTIQSLLIPPSLEETIKWAIQYVNVNDEALVLHIVNLYCDLKSYDSSIETLAKNYKAERGRGYSKDVQNRCRTASGHHSEDVQNRCRTASDHSTHSNHNSRSRTQSTDHSPPSRKPSYLHSGNSSPRRNSSRLLSATGITDPLLSAASDKLRATQQLHTKHRTRNLTLLQQLDHIKAQGTETFLKAIAPPKESSIPFSRKNWKQSSHNSTTNNLGTFARRVSISNAVIKKMSTTSPSTNSEGLLLSDSSRVHINNNNNQHRAVPPSSPRPSSSSSNGHMNNHRGGQQRQYQQQQLSSSLTHSAGRLHSPGPPSAAPCSPRPAELSTSLCAGSKTVADQRAAASFNPAQQALTALLHSTSALQSALRDKIARAQHSSKRLLRSNRNFHIKTQNLHAHTACMFEEKEFTKPINLFYQLQEFQNKNESFHSEHQLSKVLRFIRETATVESHSLYRERIIEQRWFLAIIIKLYEYMKKRKNNIPIGCIRLIVALEQIIIMGFTITTKLFYHILEETVIVKEDYSKTIVHVVVKIVRDVLVIPAEEFLHYLEKKEIPAHPELVQQVRFMNKLSSKKNTTASTSTTASSSVLRTSLILSTDKRTISNTSASKVSFVPEVSSQTSIGYVPEVCNRSVGARRSRGSVMDIPAEAGIIET